MSMSRPFSRPCVIWGSLMRFEGAIQRIASAATRFAASSNFTKAWLLPCLCLLGLARLCVLVLPFAVLRRFLGTGVGVAASVTLLSPREEYRAREVSRVIAIATRLTPWSSNCYAQAIAARLLLSAWRIPCSLFFGLALDSGGKLKAHAWVVAGRVSVTGGEGATAFSVVNSFIAGRETLQLPPWAA